MQTKYIQKSIRFEPNSQISPLGGYWHCAIYDFRKHIVMEEQTLIGSGSDCYHCNTITICSRDIGVYHTAEYSKTLKVSPKWDSRLCLPYTMRKRGL